MNSHLLFQAEENMEPNCRKCSASNENCLVEKKKKLN